LSRARHPFTIDAAVILPDHLHMIWTLPEDDEDCALGWRLIKSAFSRGLPPVVSPLGAARDLSRRLAAGDEAHPFGER